MSIDNMSKSVVVGYGRFGQLLAGYLAGSCEVGVLDTMPEGRKLAQENGFTVVSPPDIKDYRNVFLSVPISTIDQVTKNLSDFIQPGQLVVDVCSVKVHPIDCMQRNLPQAQIIGTHPMFGPDSAKDGPKGLKLAFCHVSATHEEDAMIIDFWKKLGVEVIETTPQDHDRDAVYSQSFTYTLAKIILNMHLPDVEFTTRSYEKLVEVARLSANDSDQLFHDMLFYNPYLAEMIELLGQSISATMGQVHQIAKDQQT